MAGVTAWLAVIFAAVAAESIQDSGNSTDSRPPDVPSPVHSMHRLIPSVIDTVSPRDNSTENFQPRNVTLDTSPFLPSGIVSSYRSFQPYQATGNFSEPPSNKNFTPSFFIGEVIAEPYVPERFQTSRSGEVEKNSNRSHQKIVSSETMHAIHKILPFLEHMKQSVGHSLGQEEHSFDHVPPVHEPSVEDEDNNAPKYGANYEDQHSDRPSYLPYFHGSQSLASTRPITFDNGDNFQQDSPGYPSHDPRGNGNDNFGFNGQADPYNKNPHFDHNLPLRDHAEHSGGPFFAHDNHDCHQQKDHLDHFSHHDADFVLPSPFYPSEPEHPSSHKDVHYKVHQLPMPAKYRSSVATLGLPGLEALERLGLGRLDDADCEKRAFCELAVLGGREEASAAQRGLWKLANSFPEQYAATLGLDRMLKAVKANSCSSLKCVDSAQNTMEKSSSSKSQKSNKAI